MSIMSYTIYTIIDNLSQLSTSLYVLVSIFKYYSEVYFKYFILLCMLLFE